MRDSFSSSSARFSLNSDSRVGSSTRSILMSNSLLLSNDGSTVWARYSKRGGRRPLFRRNRRQAPVPFVGVTASNKSKDSATAASSLSICLTARTTALRPSAW
jgi:hypothetical protein